MYQINPIRMIDSLKYRSIIAIAAFFVFIVHSEWMYGITAYGGFYKIPARHFMSVNFFAVFMNVSVMILLFKVCKYLIYAQHPLKHQLAELSKYSFGIYLVHVFILELLKKFTYVRFLLTSDRWIFYPIYFIAMLAGSYLIIKAIAKIRFHYVLIGKVGVNPNATVQGENA